MTTFCFVAGTSPLLLPFRGAGTTYRYPNPRTASMVEPGPPGCPSFRRSRMMPNFTRSGPIPIGSFQASSSS